MADGDGPVIVYPSNKNARTDVRQRWIAFGVLAVVGLSGWPIIFGNPAPSLVTLGEWGPKPLSYLLTAVAVLGLLPGVAPWLDWWLNRFRHPRPAVQAVVSVLIGALFSCLLWCTANLEQRQFFPYIHDEFSYLIQAHQLATGHLWMPAHPLGKFFGSFQLFNRPVYASAYFPGTALLHVPGVWMHWPPFVTTLVISGCVAGLLFWIITELTDGVAGFLAVLLLLSDAVYRQLSIMTLGQMPLLFYALFAMVAWLKWRKNTARRWAIATGFFLGLAAITRPVDALCFAIPICIAACRKNPRAMGLIIVGGLPCMALQLVMNHGITGSWIQTPFGLYARQEYPGSGFGFHQYDALARPESDLPQLRALYRQYQPGLQQHRSANILHDLMSLRLRYVVSQIGTAPFPVLILLAPFCLLKAGRGRWALLVTGPLFLLLYAFYVFFFGHYVLTCAPAVIGAIVIGTWALGSFTGKPGRFARVALTLFITGEALAALPWWSGWSDDMIHADLIADVNHQLGRLHDAKAVVFFRFDPGRDLHQEPVYNYETAWPDAGRIIRAHDLGSQNAKLMHYYRDRFADCKFYLFDENDRHLERLPD